MNDPVLLDAVRGCLHAHGVRGVLQAIADICDEATERERGKPASTIGSINAGIVRQAAQRVIE